MVADIDDDDKVDMCPYVSQYCDGISLHFAIAIGMCLHGFEKRILPDINKRSSLGKRWEQAEA